MTVRRTGSALLPIVAVVLAGCAGSTTAASSRTASTAATAAAGSTAAAPSGRPQPSGQLCAAQAAGHSQPLPAGFPTDFPLPPGMIVTTAQDRGAAGIVLTGVTDQPFQATLDALHTELPERGYTAEDGESEPHDAESDFSSSRYRGRWAIRQAAGCPDDTSIQVVARHR